MKSTDHSGHPDGNVSRFDARALRFALVFPVLLSLALAGGSLLLKSGLPRGIELPWEPGFVPVPVFVAVAAAAMLGIGGGLGALGAATMFPGNLRRVFLGVAMALQLSIFSLFVAALLGQGAPGDFPPQRMSGFVAIMGCGLSAAMGLVLALSNKPAEQWSRTDDAALAALVDPDAAAEEGRLSHHLHPRSSVIIMILLAALLPGALLAILSPWLFVALLLAALAAIAALCATVTADAQRITVAWLGLLPAIVVPYRDVVAAAALDLVAADHGWGLRRRRGSASFLARGGAGVVLRLHDGGRVVLGAPDREAAGELAAWVNRRAGTTPS